MQEPNPEATLQGSPPESHNGNSSNPDLALQGSWVHIPSRSADAGSAATHDEAALLVTASSLNSGIDITTATSTHDGDIHIGASPPTHTRQQYIPDDRTDHYRAYKQRRSIQGAILVLATFQPSTLDKPAPNTLQFPNLANIFAAYPHYLMSS